MADFNLTSKQTLAWKYLMDNSTREVLFGSAAGSGKSFLGCLWVVTMCIKYPGVRYLIGRSVLTQLRLTTLRTLLETLGLMGLKPETHYTYNQQSNVISFYNGSEIILKDLASTPSDPMYDSLGSLEITGAFVDEMSQVPQMAYHIIKSRMRFKLNQYNLIPKLFMSCNPGTNFLKKDFYIPWREDRLEDNKKFVPATALDNPHLPPSYIETLMQLPEQQKQRLLLGNWDYTDDINSIFTFDSIVDAAYRFGPNSDDKKYLSVDVARFGSDRSVCVVWVGLVAIEIVVMHKLSTTDLATRIRDLIASHGIHPSNVIVDSDGVGGGVADIIKGTNFINNAKALHDQNFSNLKSQCYVKLADLFKEGKISINVLDSAVVDELTQELLSVKLKDVDKDNKVAVASKDEMKKMLGKSPDLSDAFMMRMYYEIKNLKATNRYAISFI